MASPVRQFATPYIIRGALTAGVGTRLEKIEPTRRTDGESQSLYQEAWIQQLIFENPSLLPVNELEPGFGALYSVCRELPTPAGPLDNLFVSENGGLVLVECKLYRNSEARREVIGQALDYAKAISRMSYDDLARAVGRSVTPAEGGLYGAVSRRTTIRAEVGATDSVDSMGEAEFNDAVTRNLKRGRFVLLIVGDGIHEGVEEITNFLQLHIGLDFTFGLVELRVFKVPNEEQYVVQPRILANSYTVERGVIRVDSAGVVSVEQPAGLAQPPSGSSGGKRTSISEQAFYEQLSANTSVKLADDLKLFMERLADIEVIPAFGASSLNLRWFPPASDRKMNFGSVYKSGLVDTDPANWVPGGLGRRDIGEAYQEALKTIVGGSLKQAKNGAGYTLRVVCPDGTNISLAELLKHQDAWIELMKKTQAELAKAVQAYEGD
jgi:hypothetical protein